MNVHRGHMHKNSNIEISETHQPTHTQNITFLQYDIT